MKDPTAWYAGGGVLKQPIRQKELGGRWGPGHAAWGSRSSGRGSMGQQVIRQGS